MDAKQKSIKDFVLGKDYDLCLSFISVKKIKELNKKYRGLNESTDILSFELENNIGEIFICKEAARKKARIFARPSANYLLFIFIHGLAHLKGMPHGAKMDRLEKSARKKFGI